MNIRIICCMLLTCLTLNSSAQKVSPLRREYINTVLSDFGIGYILVFNIKLEGVDTEKVYITPNWILYSYFKKKFGWGTTQYIDTMRHYLFSGKPMIVDDEDYFDTKDLPPIGKCKALFNVSSDSLMHLFAKTDYNPSYCLMVKCFSKNILLLHSDTYTGVKICIEKFPLPKDIDPYTGARIKKDK